MTLVEEIQREAVDSNSDLSALLRKCKLLAARLGSRPLEEWLLWESNGYPEGDDVPTYRIWPLRIKGHFAGPLGSGIRNATIPWICIPEESRSLYQNYKLRQSIASIEDILRRTEHGTMHVSTGDLAVALGTNVYEHQNCVEAWAEFSVSNLVEVLNAVRNRILDFTLAVWKEAPAAGEMNDKTVQDIKPGRVTQIFNTTVYGGAANLVGSAANSSVTFNVSQNDLASLERVLRDNGIPDKDVDELKKAIVTDGQLEGKRGFGPRVSSWIGAMLKRAAEGSWMIGLEAAGNLLALAISRYYGM